MNKTLAIIPIILALMIVVFFVSNDYKDSMLGTILDSVAPVDWSEVAERNIVKNAVRIKEIEKIGDGMCIFDGGKMSPVLEHQYFIQSESFAKDIRYNLEDNTLIYECQEKDTVMLSVWYVVEESSRHSTKYQHFVTEDNMPPSE